MDNKDKYIDGKKLLLTKRKISATIPLPIYEDLMNYARLTGESITDVVSSALFDFFRKKIVTNDNLIGYGNLYFELPLTTTFKTNAIANKIKLNKDIETTEPTEPIFIKTVTNNLDIFNGFTYFAGSELEKENINHIGLNFIVIPNAIKLSNISDDFDININDALYVFYYEVSSVNNIDVFLINPIDAVNKLSAVNSNIESEKLISCLQDLEYLEKEIIKKYTDEISQTENIKTTKIKYCGILKELLTEIADKYNTESIKIGFDAVDGNIKDISDKIDMLKNQKIKQN